MTAAPSIVLALALVAVACVRVRPRSPRDAEVLREIERWRAGL